MRLTRPNEEGLLIAAQEWKQIRKACGLDHPGEQRNTRDRLVRSIFAQQQKGCAQVQQGR